MRFSESQTLMLYLGVGFMTIICIYIADYLNGKKTMVLSYGRHRWNTAKIKNAFLYALVSVGMCSIFAGRGVNVGSDTYNYYKKYQTIDSIGLFDAEPLYLLLNKICSMLGLSFSQFQFVVCLITCFFVVSAIYFYLDNNKRHVVVAVSLYYLIYFFISMNISRQLIAVAIVLYSVKYLISKQYFKYFLMCMVAAGFHSSAMIALCFYIAPILEYSGDKKRRYWYYIILTIITILAAPILSVVSKIFSLEYAVSSTFRLGFLKDYIVPLLLIVLYELHVLSEKKDDEVFKIIKNIFLLSIPLRTLGYGAPAMMRIAHYSAIFQVVLIPMLLSKVRNKYIRMLCFLLVAVVYVYLFITEYLTVNRVFPYSTWDM